MVAVARVPEVAHVADSCLNVEVRLAHLWLCLDGVCLADGTENFVSFQISVILVPIYGNRWIHLDANACHVISVRTKEVVVARPVTFDLKAVFNTLLYLVRLNF